MDADEWWPEHIFAKIGEQRPVRRHGPAGYGGAAATWWRRAGAQGLSRWNHALGLSWVAHENLCVNNIFRNGNEAQRRKYLPELCAGRLIGALGLTEPGAGSDALGSMRTTARRDGDHYVLNGSKIYITNGPVADVLLVYAKTDRGEGRARHFRLHRRKGFSRFPCRAEAEKMGFRGSQTAELVFEDCRVPAENLIGVENRGVTVVMSGLDLERAMIAPLCLGIAERAFELLARLCQDAPAVRQSDRMFQMVQSMLADMYVWVETMRTFTYRMLAAAAAGGDRGGRTRRHPHVDRRVGHVCRRFRPSVLDKAMHIHGGVGYIWESEINRLFGPSSCWRSAPGQPRCAS